MPAYPAGETLAIGGCVQVFIDKASGKLASRPELGKALVAVRVTIWW